MIRRLLLPLLTAVALAPFAAAAITDGTPPTVSSITPVTTYKNQVTTYEVTTSDDLAGVAGCDLYVNTVNQGAMTMTFLSGMSWKATRAYTYTGSAGTISVYARCRDSAASPNFANGATTSVTIFVDSSPPVVSNILPATATAGVATTVSADVAETGSGINTCGLIVNGVESGLMSAGAGGSYSIAATFPSAGSYTVEVNCFDRATNFGTASRTVTVAASDSTAPVVSAVSPTTATQNVSTTISVTATDNVAMHKCTTTIDGVFSSSSMSQSGSSFTESRTFTTTGSHSVSVFCDDTAGNGTTVSGTITVSAASGDTTDPVISNLQPGTATTGVATSITATYSDNVGVSVCHIQVNGLQDDVNASLSGGVGSTSGTATFTRTFSTPGSYTILVFCEDAAGNESNTLTRTITASAAAGDGTAPSVAGLGPSTAVVGSAVMLTATVSDNVGINTCTLFIGGSSIGTMTVSSGVASRSHTFTSAGSYAAEVRCTDAAANTGTGSLTVVASAAPATADAASPTVGMIAQTSATVGVPVTLTAAVADNVGIASCTLYISGSNVGTMAVSGGIASRSYTFGASGTAGVYALCADAAGNEASGAQRSLTVAAGAGATSSDPDADGDDIADADEAVWGTESNDNDSDNDGFTDGTELRNGYNPTGSGVMGAPTAFLGQGQLIKLGCPDGALITDPCKAVYYYGRDGKRHAFPSEKIYRSWFSSFNMVKIVNPTNMAAIPVGKNVLFRPGVRLVKFQTVNTVYVVARHGELRAVASESVAASLYGSGWGSKIDDVSDILFGNFTFGSNVNSSADYNPSAATAGTTALDASFS